MDSFIFVENVFLHGNRIIFRKPLLIRGCQMPNPRTLKYRRFFSDSG